MPTYIVIPRAGLGPRIQELADQPAALAAASATMARETLQDSGFENRPVLTANGLLAPNGEVLATGLKASEIARDQNDACVLEGLDVILVDDLDDQAITLLRDRAVILDNVQVPGIEPIAESAAATCTSWHLQKINVAAARQKNLTGSGVRVGILDTGIDSGHPEFAGKNIGFAEYDTRGFLISTTAHDAGSHGTHVAALVAGRTCGVAPQSDLAVAAVLTTSTTNGYSGYFAQILAGLNWVAHSNHAPSGCPISQCPVINASLGSSGYNSYLYPALHTVRQAPAAQLCAAIGNDGTSVNRHSSPANYDTVAGIGATDSGDVVALFSDWGIEATSGALKPDLSAPGVDICSAVPGGGYALKSGTSMASPLVAGAAALLIQQTPTLARNPATLLTRLLRLVDHTAAVNPHNRAAGYNRVGAGRLDLSNI